MPRVPHQIKTHHSFEHTSVSEALPSILTMLLADGQEVGSRQGERTMEILMPRIALWKPWQREVLVPGRKASIAAQIAETMWVLAGRNDIEWLSHYLPRAGDFSDDGTTWTGGYGPRIRRWRSQPLDNETFMGVDQLARVVDLLNRERGTRRAVMSIYDPSIDSVGGKDVPCNDFITFISRLGKLHMSVTTRSNDVIWGWSGINQFEWSVLQEIVAKLTGNQIGTLTFNITSLHVYEKHWDKARKIMNADPLPDYMANVQDSPKFDPDVSKMGHIGDRLSVEMLDDLIEGWFDIENSIRMGDPRIGDVDRFPEPMMRSWLRVLQWYWSPPNVGPWMESLIGSRLHVAAEMSPTRAGLRKENAFVGLKAKVTTVEPDGTVTGEVTAETGPGLYEMLARTANGEYSMSIKEVKPDGTVTETPVEDLFITKSEPFMSTRGKEQPLLWTSQFVEYVDNLHREKSAVYGDSWKKRGEQMSILANIARKIDRLGEGGAGDTAADTVIDLLVYLAKYALWLNQKGEPEAPLDDENEFVWGVLQSEDRRSVKVVQHASIQPRIVALKEFFEQLAIVVREHEIGNALQARMEIVDHMISLAFPTARYFWGVENGHILSPEKATGLFTTPQGAAAVEAGRRAELNAGRRWEGYEVGENID
jgi:thymidylate synthase